MDGEEYPYAFVAVAPGVEVARMTSSPMSPSGWRPTRKIAACGSWTRFRSASGKILRKDLRALLAVPAP
jgi:hypothetical protein